MTELSYAEGAGVPIRLGFMNSWWMLL